ncbi:MAG: response regulator [Candidatus Omnitrophota bacterium]|jgi:two-component system chemotaxis response regulator CheY|nr:MAG: response regulator [Candidatus Omnitrophota bacterium]
MSTIMIVDDAAFMRATLKDILVKAGHEVIYEAQNGKDAVKNYKRYQPDIVTMDITMPEMNGIEALKQLKELDQEVKVIMITAVGQQANVMEALRLGAKDFIVKPFQPDRVKEALMMSLA